MPKNYFPHKVLLHTRIKLKFYLTLQALYRTQGKICSSRYGVAPLLYKCECKDLCYCASYCQSPLCPHHQAAALGK